VRQLIFTKVPATNYAIVITGDLVNNAAQSNHYEEASIYVGQLRTAGFTVLISPGNHDVGTGALGSSKYVPQFKSAFFGDESVVYPKRDILDDVAFFALDSMEQELHWYDALGAEGELGDGQLGRLAEALRAPDVQACRKRVVYLHHHPFSPRPGGQLKDSAKLAKAINGARVDAILFGHNHSGDNWNGVWGIPRAYDGSSTTGKLSKPTPVRVMDLERDPREDYGMTFGI
jgi:3',5'-cyclic AMP phosphodiesterase CpdA